MKYSTHCTHRPVQISQNGNPTQRRGGATTHLHAKVAPLLRAAGAVRTNAGPGALGLGSSTYVRYYYEARFARSLDRSFVRFTRRRRGFSFSLSNGSVPCRRCDAREGVRRRIDISSSVHFQISPVEPTWFKDRE